MQKTAPLIFVSGVHLWVGVWFDAYAMTLTEKVYTHFDVKELVNAINKI